MMGTVGALYVERIPRSRGPLTSSGDSESQAVGAENKTSPRQFSTVQRVLYASVIAMRKSPRTVPSEHRRVAPTAHTLLSNVENNQRWSGPMGSSAKFLVPRESVDRSVYLSRIPDTILPSQFFASIGARTFSSEQRLMLAVLADAINVLASTKHRRRNSFNEAWSWVNSDRVIGSLSFDHVCDALRVDVEYLRRRLSELISVHDGNLRRLRLKQADRRQGPTINRVRRR